MIIFDQLRISDDGKRIYINLHVNTADYFRNITLESLVVMTADKVSETNPYQPTEDYIYKKEYENGVREDALVLTSNDCETLFSKSSFSSDLFFVYVKVKGLPDACTPCRLDEEITIGVTFDVNMLYQIVMQFTRQLANKCDIPQEFLDIILLWNGFKAAIETEHYISAIDFWNKIFHNRSSSKILGGCGCHG